MLVGGADGSEAKKKCERKQEVPSVRGEGVEKPRGKKPGVSFCPKCGSTNIFWASGLPQLWSIWDCRNCGYRGAFVLRDGKLAEKLSQNYRKKTVRT
jgi:predicted RNA-binding Zn-ribbon protein involved in translation (DUF1610 family)